MNGDTMSLEKASRYLEDVMLKQSLLEQKLNTIVERVERLLRPQLYEVRPKTDWDPGSEPLYCHTRELANESMSVLRWGVGLPYIIVTGPDHPLGPNEKVDES